MLQSLYVKNFRCFEDLHIDSLSKVNLFTGKNNVGKSSLLEALFILAGAENASNIIKIAGFRQVGNVRVSGSTGDVEESIKEMFWLPLFRGYAEDNIVSIGGKYNGKNVEVQMSLVYSGLTSIDIEGQSDTNGFPIHLLYSWKGTEDENPKLIKMNFSYDKNEFVVEPAPSRPLFPGYYIGPRHYGGAGEDAENFGKLITDKKRYDLDIVDILRETIEPRLNSLTSVPRSGSAMLFGDIGLDKMLPMIYMGDGIRRLVSILIVISRNAGGIVMIDEIDSGLHYSVQKDIWRAIAKAARQFDVQIFATTHSFECLRDAHLAFSQADKYELGVHRLERYKNTVKAITLDKEMVDVALESGLEVR